MSKTCFCGKPVPENIKWPPYQKKVTDLDGNILYAVCIHGEVVVDNFPTGNFIIKEKDE